MCLFLERYFINTLPGLSVDSLWTPAVTSFVWRRGFRSPRRSARKEKSVCCRHKHSSKQVTSSDDTRKQAAEMFPLVSDVYLQRHMVWNLSNYHSSATLIDALSAYPPSHPLSSRLFLDMEEEEEIICFADPTRFRTDPDFCYQEFTRREEDHFQVFRVQVRTLVNEGRQCCQDWCTVCGL